MFYHQILVNLMVFAGPGIHSTGKDLLMFSCIAKTKVYRLNLMRFDIIMANTYAPVKFQFS